MWAYFLVLLLRTSDRLIIRTELRPKNNRDFRRESRENVEEDKSWIHVLWAFLDWREEVVLSQSEESERQVALGNQKVRPREMVNSWVNLSLISIIMRSTLLLKHSTQLVISKGSKVRGLHFDKIYTLSMSSRYGNELIRWQYWWKVRWLEIYYPRSICLLWGVRSQI